MSSTQSYLELFVIIFFLGKHEKIKKEKCIWNFEKSIVIGFHKKNSVVVLFRLNEFLCGNWKPQSQHYQGCPCVNLANPLSCWCVCIADL